jgi:hypothetical protein
MQSPHRVMQAFFVLAISVSLVCAGSTPWLEEPSRLPSEENNDAPPRKPTPGEIVSWTSRAIHLDKNHY